MRRWQAHDLETWAIHFQSRQRGEGSSPMIYTGADDCCFKAWDARGDLERPVFVNRREHGAGVTCIASSPHDSNVVVTGSYDEFLRLWDVRNTSRPVMRVLSADTDKVHCGGGVWRIKFHPVNPKLLLVACMHDGFKIMHVDYAADALEADGAHAPVRTMHHYEGHASLAYGADWVRMQGNGGDGVEDKEADASCTTAIVATCSFYDRALHVWEAQL